MALTRGAVSKLADRLISKELIVKAPNADDGRAHKLKLTKAGMSLVPQLAALADQNETECLTMIFRRSNAFSRTR
jgi:DNA-binding MarR family transcriptional regulator